MGLTIPADVVIVCPATLVEVFDIPVSVTGVATVVWLVGGLKTGDGVDTAFITELTAPD